MSSYSKKRFPSQNQSYLSHNMVIPPETKNKFHRYLQFDPNIPQDYTSSRTEKFYERQPSPQEQKSFQFEYRHIQDQTPQVSLLTAGLGSGIMKELPQPHPTTNILLDPMSGQRRSIVGTTIKHPRYAADAILQEPLRISPEGTISYQTPQRTRNRELFETLREQ